MKSDHPLRKERIELLKQLAAGLIDLSHPAFKKKTQCISFTYDLASGLIFSKQQGRFITESEKRDEITAANPEVILERKIIHGF